ncbi:hypothetical protein [Candidatus Synchoanobacter obligatus]|uniref:Uncharacterized protein n=1 Tax=Candidatus Synchoanobacter obligatus TaxID=2919597 RepID=A0ABT1L5S0_9GAMM|nr:hypothetical protein [Candidatus Synchoanobacter obligatus]MCP8352529.1 hypothetical protein [Candidatus Synchoanobacter obligatus]
MKRDGAVFNVEGLKCRFRCLYRYGLQWWVAKIVQIVADDKIAASAKGECAASRTENIAGATWDILMFIIFLC